jgi:hypothetical protein
MEGGPMSDVSHNLVTQLKTMSFDRPESVVNSLDLLHFHFHNEDYNFASSNKILMLGEQLSSIKSDLDSKLKLINSVLFEKEKFYVSTSDESALFLSHLFTNKTCHPTLMSFVYQFLLKKLNVKFKVWSSKNPHLIQVYEDDRTYVINLLDNGEKAKGKDLTEPCEDVSISPFDQIYNLLTLIADKVLLKNNYEKTLKIYDCILYLFPEKVSWYARRGLLKKNLGLFSEALKDLEKYGNYVAEKDFSNSVTQALIELKGLKHTNIPQGLHH